MSQIAKAIYADYEYCFICDGIYDVKRRLHDYFWAVIVGMSAFGLSKLNEVGSYFTKVAGEVLNPRPGMRGPTPMSLLLLQWTPRFQMRMVSFPHDKCHCQPNAPLVVGKCRVNLWAYCGYIVVYSIVGS